MGQRLLAGPLVALYLASVQWLVSALFANRFELFYSLVPLSALTVITAEAALMIRMQSQVDGRAAASSLAQAIWCFQFSVLGFATVTFIAGTRGGPPSPGDLWRGWEWVVTMVVVAYVSVTWFRLERRAEAQ